MFLFCLHTALAFATIIIIIVAPMHNLRGYVKKILQILCPDYLNLIFEHQKEGITLIPKEKQTAVTNIDFLMTQENSSLENEKFSLKFSISNPCWPSAAKDTTSC